MNRRQVVFNCEGALLCGTIDEAAGETGLLIVSGGNEIRSGAWGGQASLAAAVAGSGHPVFRYDRRGVGDSEGRNSGFRGAAADLACAVAAFRTEAPHLRRVVAFGNCDAASVLALHGTQLPIDELILANPWTVDDDQAAEVMPASAIRSRYLKKLQNPDEWLRILRGQVNFANLVTGLRRAAGPSAPSQTGLAAEMHARLSAFSGPIKILIAAGDRTAQIFAENWPKGDRRVRSLADRSHSFSGERARAWLLHELLEALQR